MVKIVFKLLAKIVFEEFLNFGEWIYLSSFRGKGWKGLWSWESFRIVSFVSFYCGNFSVFLRIVLIFFQYEKKSQLTTWKIKKKIFLGKITKFEIKNEMKCENFFSCMKSNRAIFTISSASNHKLIFWHFPCNSTWLVITLPEMWTNLIQPFQSSFTVIKNTPRAFCWEHFQTPCEFMKSFCFSICIKMETLPASRNTAVKRRWKKGKFMIKCLIYSSQFPSR